MGGCKLSNYERSEHTCRRHGVCYSAYDHRKIFTTEVRIQFKNILITEGSDCSQITYRMFLSRFYRFKCLKIAINLILIAFFYLVNWFNCPYTQLDYNVKLVSLLRAKQSKYSN
jgi:hypothetical protein